MENIFLADQKPISFEDYLRYDESSRGNLGADVPVLVYRMLEYSLKDALIDRFGKEVQIELFRKAGRTAGEYFARHFLDLSLPLNQFVGELQAKMQE